MISELRRKMITEFLSAPEGSELWIKHVDTGSTEPDNWVRLRTVCIDESILAGTLINYRIVTPEYKEVWQWWLDGTLYYSGDLWNTATSDAPMLIADLSVYSSGPPKPKTKKVTLKPWICNYVDGSYGIVWRSKSPHNDWTPAPDNIPSYEIKVPND